MKRIKIYLATLILSMFCCTEVWGGNTIYYTSSDGVVNPYYSFAFGGAQIVSNTCTDGQGTIVFDKDVTEIGDYAFHGCLKLTSITLPESVTEIGDCAFKGCPSLESINIPKSVTTIGEWAFSDCSSLTSITVDSENKVYDSRNDCNAIIETATNTLVAGCATTVIPEDVTTIGFSAFYNCTSLTSINIPEGVTMIGIYAFYDCKSLTSVTLPESVTTIGEWAFGLCESLTSITLPESVTEISIGAFKGCLSLKSVTIPEGVTMIGYRAFYECSSLESINIPESVTTIGEWAFGSCKSLTSVTVNWATPLTVPDNLFADIPYLSSVTLHVPAGTTDLYRAANVWKEFNIVDAGFYELKSAAIGSLTAIVGDINDEDITHMLNKYISQIQSATSATEMISAQTEGEEVLTAMVKLYHRLNVDLPSEGMTGHGVRVILEEEGKEDIKLELMNPSRVEFFKR